MGTHIDHLNERHALHIATRERRERAAHLAEVAAAHLREATIVLAPHDSGSFAQLQAGVQQSISAAANRLVSVNVAIAELEALLASLSATLQEAA